MKSIALLLISTLLFIFRSNGQKRLIDKENFVENIYTKCQYPPFFGMDSLDLQKYLNEQLLHQIATTSGEITISLVIDSTGKPFCEEIENNSNLSISNKKLKTIFDSMPNWNSGIQNGYKVNCAEIVELYFDEKNLQVLYKIGRK